MLKVWHFFSLYSTRISIFVKIFKLIFEAYGCVLCDVCRVTKLVKSTSEMLEELPLYLPRTCEW